MKKSFKHCPVCKHSEQVEVRPDLGKHPYVGCPECGLYYQPNPVEKVYEAPHEHRGDLMSDADKSANMYLANQILNNWKKNSKPTQAGFKYHLDIGTKYPYLGHCLQKLGKDYFLKSYGIDGIDLVGHFGDELGVKVLQTDFESPIQEWEYPEGIDPELFQGNHFSIISLVHCVEHFYKPLQSLKKIHHLAVDNALVFIRCPDSDTPGIERDFTHGHYLIHPLIWNLQSMLKAINTVAEEGFRFELLSTGSFHGQRDYWLRVKK